MHDLGSSPHSPMPHSNHTHSFCIYTSLDKFLLDELCQMKILSRYGVKRVNALEWCVCVCVLRTYGQYSWWARWFSEIEFAGDLLSVTLLCAAVLSRVWGSVSPARQEGNLKLSAGFKYPGGTYWHLLLVWLVKAGCPAECLINTRGLARQGAPIWACVLSGHSFYSIHEMY